MNDEDSIVPPPPPPPPPQQPPHPAPPTTRGWYADPEEPEYQRFWSGQAWTSRRYWGSFTAADATSQPPDSPEAQQKARLIAPPTASPPPPLLPRRPIPQSRVFGPPLNPRGKVRSAFVVVAFLVVGVVYLSLHIFPLEPFAVVFGIGLVYLAAMWPARSRFLHNPARLAALSEPVVFQARVFVRFIYAPTRSWVYLRLGRWDIGVRTDTFQITNWVWGNRRRATSAFFHSADCVMWQGNSDGRDCIVVSGPTYLRSKVEFALSTEGRNSDAWNALALSGVRGLPGPPDATTPADPAPPMSVGDPPPHTLSASSIAGLTPPAAPTKGFRRLGQDLGSRRAREVTPHAGSLPSTAPLPVDVPMPVPRSGSGPGRGKPPLPARMSPLVIVGVVLAAAAFLSLPSLLALAQQGVGVSPDPGRASVSPPEPALPPVETTQCTLNADADARGVDRHRHGDGCSR